jgi:PilZ domain
MSVQQSVPTQAGSAPGEKRANKRLHERLAINCQVHLCWKDGQSDRVLRAQALDVSSFGMLVESERAIPPGTFIQVQTTLTILGLACVRHCTPKGLRFRIGLHMPDRSVRDF